LLGGSDSNIILVWSTYCGFFTKLKKVRTRKTLREVNWVRTFTS